MDKFGLLTNIKQIGSVDENLRIYLEDKVFTYLVSYAEAEKDYENIGVLLGRCMIIDGKKVLYICGTIFDKDSKVDNGLLSFTDKSFKNFEKIKEKYFKGCEIVGWVLSQPSFGSFLSGGYSDYHFDTFKRDYNTLYLIDPVERVHTFYAYKEDDMDLVECGGYFVYYDKESLMTEYAKDYPIPKPKQVIKNNSIVQDNSSLRDKNDEPKQEEYYTAEQEVINKLDNNARRRKNGQPLSLAFEDDEYESLQQRTKAGSVEEMFRNRDEARKNNDNINNDLRNNDIRNNDIRNSDTRSSEARNDPRYNRQLPKKFTSPEENKKEEIIPIILDNYKQIATVAIVFSALLIGSMQINNKQKIATLEAEVLNIKNGYAEAQTISEEDTTAVTTSGGTLVTQNDTSESDTEETKEDTTQSDTSSSSITNDTESKTPDEEKDTSSISNNETDASDKSLAESLEKEKSSETATYIPETYIVEVGDSLLSISLYFYGTKNKVYDIMQLNGIENADDIKVGMLLQMPKQ